MILVRVSATDQGDAAFPSASGASEHDQVHCDDTSFLCRTVAIQLLISASSSIAARATRACFQRKLQDQKWLQLWRRTRRALSGELISFCFGVCYFLGVLSAHASLFFSTGLCAAKNAMLHKGKEASPSVSRTLVRPKCDPLSIEFAKQFDVPHA